MAQIFPKWANKIPLLAALVVVFGGAALVGFVWYYFSPEYTDVGYRPTQPVPFSHKLHAGDLGMDCRYCHNTVEQTAWAAVPPTTTCMNCHKLVLPESEKLLPVRESFATGRPIEWVRVHKIPDYAFFNHGVHVRAGVGCFSCHGNVRQMEIVKQEEPLSMGWCLDCHRNPDQFLRPLDEVTNMEWTPPADQEEFAKRVKAERTINPPTDCSGCHR
ncbi:cytochrome c3 family protein [bacterium]|nr:cytochrome c3 family protein [bacterium]